MPSAGKIPDGFSFPLPGSFLRRQVILKVQGEIGCSADKYLIALDQIHDCPDFSSLSPLL